MVPAWIAAAAWLAAWTALAWISMRLLAKARPDEKIPLIIKVDGQARWFVSPAVAAGLVPMLSVISGVTTVAAGFLLSHGRAPVMNVVLAAVFVFTHGVYVRRALEWLGRQPR
jgi:hypothetical protein